MKNLVEGYFNYPSSVVLVDDNKEFLDNLSLILQTHNHELNKTFLQPKKALSYLKKQNYIYKNYQNFLESLKAVELDADDRDVISKINYANILNLIYNKNRFKEVSVIVVDYFMPEMNGLSFFKEIKNIPAKKILLTGNYDYQMAVDAFNHGLIDRFILKADNTGEKILDAVNELKGEYFQGFSTVLLKAFNKGTKKAEQYMTIFADWNDKNKIREYYQADGNGSCIGFDQKGEIHWLLITSESDMCSYIDILKEEQESPSVIKSLEQKEKLLFFLTENDKRHPISDWNKHMFKIHGSFTIEKEKYFYSYTSKNSLGINTKDIATWGRYKLPKK